MSGVWRVCVADPQLSSTVRRTGMDDPLAPVGQFMRTVSAVLMTMATFAFVGLLLLGITHHVSTGSPYYNGKPFWVGTVLFAVLAPASAWLTIRLWSPPHSSSRVLLMPVWFIEVYGLLSAAGFVWLALSSSHPWYSMNGLGVVLAMVFIRRSVRRKFEERGA